MRSSAPWGKVFDDGESFQEEYGRYKALGVVLLGDWIAAGRTSLQMLEKHITPLLED
jgi:hypothetical protein